MKVQLARPTLGEAEENSVLETIRSGWLTQGPKVEAFEKDFAEHHGVNHAAAVSSGTAALHLALLGLEVGAGDEVLCPAFSWVATANAVVLTGATPVLVDVEPRTFNLDPNQIQGKITPKTRALIVVHQFGLPAEMNRIDKAAPGIPLIEDAACAVGAEYRGQKVGAYGTAAAFSFHPRKVITTGEGGMITTNSDRIATAVRQLRNHGLASVSEPWNLPDLSMPGFNYRMNDIQASLGQVQLKYLDRLLESRRKGAEFYLKELAGSESIQLPQSPPDCRSSWQSFVCRVNPRRSPRDRNALIRDLEARGVQTRPGTQAIHQLCYYRSRFGYTDADFPVASACAKDSIALPLHDGMTPDDYAYVVENVRDLTR